MVLPPGADVPTAQRLGPIDQESAAALMARAPSWWRILTDPFDGAIIDWAHERYSPTPAQGRADHTIERQDGGTAASSIRLCQEAARAQGLIDAQRQADSGAHDAAGGEDAWLMTELN